MGSSRTRPTAAGRGGPSLFLTDPLTRASSLARHSARVQGPRRGSKPSFAQRSRCPLHQMVKEAGFLPTTFACPLVEPTQDPCPKNGLPGSLNSKRSNEPGAAYLRWIGPSWSES